MYTAYIYRPVRAKVCALARTRRPLRLHSNKYICHSRVAVCVCVCVRGVGMVGRLCRDGLKRANNLTRKNVCACVLVFLRAALAELKVLLDSHCTQYSTQVPVRDL